MDYLFSRWDNLKEKLKNKFLFIFLDYDGTLTPIVGHPRRAKLCADTKALLRDVLKNPQIKLSVISGRALGDLKRRAGIKKIIYAGNHGMEIEGCGVKFRIPVSLASDRIIRLIKKNLKKKLSGIKGVFLEDKGLTLSLHYRLAAKKDLAAINSIFKEITRDYIVKNKIKVKQGKKVWEIRPPVAWDKGSVVLWLLKKAGYGLSRGNILPVYIGDDSTDEDAFRALRNKGLTVFVGRPRKSAAGYYLNNSQETGMFLRRVLKLKERPICRN